MDTSVGGLVEQLLDLAHRRRGLIETRHRSVLERGPDLHELVPEARDRVDLHALAVALIGRVARRHRRRTDVHEVDGLARVARRVRVGDVLGRDVDGALLRLQRGERESEAREV